MPRAKEQFRLPLNEATIQRTCVQFMEAHGWRHLRTDPVSDRGRAKGFGEPGMADSLFIRYGSPCDEHRDRLAALKRGLHCGRPVATIIWIEWKRRGGRATEHQKAWHRYERTLGAMTLIAGEDFEASIEGFMAFYQASGL